jgi:NitT/TauT family transport system ATP-binding protein
VREAWITERRDAGRHTAGRRTGRVTSFETAAVGSPALLASAPARVAPAPPARPVIEARSLSVLFEAGGTPVHALSDVDLTVRAGQFVSLIGPSGCGKTTLLRVIADLELATSGTVTVNGLDPRAAREARQYGYVFQAPALLPWRTVLGNVTLPLEIAGLPRAERRARALEELRLVGLDGFAAKFPWQLSGGMQQRVSIARALSLTPGLLLMDEPFGALDEITRDRLNLQLAEVLRRTGTTCVFVTHSIQEAVFLSTHIVVMSPRPGRVLDVIESPLPRERDLEIRETPAFLEVAARVRRGLRHGHSYDD